MVEELIMDMWAELMLEAVELIVIPVIVEALSVRIFPVGETLSVEKLPMLPSIPIFH